MRDQMSQDDHDLPSSSVTSPSRQHSSPALSHTDFPSVSHKDERSALPAAASWGKSSMPSTPIAKHSVLQEDITPLTSDAFGPTLAMAVAQQQQKHQLSPTVLKRKLEKKKRKELAKQRKEEEEEEEQQQEGEVAHSPTESLWSQGLVDFVLGRAFSQMLPVDPLEEEQEETLPISSLYQDRNDSAGPEENYPSIEDKLDQLHQIVMALATSISPALTAQSDQKRLSELVLPESRGPIQLPPPRSSSYNNSGRPESQDASLMPAPLRSYTDSAYGGTSPPLPSIPERVLG